MESLRIFGILLRKCWLVSKRHWIKTLLGQILLPIGFVISAWLIFESDASTPEIFETDSHYEIQSSEELIDDYIRRYSEGVPIFYSPNNSFTDDLMMNVHKCFKNKTNMQKFHTEADIVDFYRKNSHTFGGIAVVFDESTDSSTKHLHFKLQVKSLPHHKLYYPSPRPTVQYLQNSPFMLLQICLSESFVRIKINESNEDIPQTFIQEEPYPAHIEKPPTFSVAPICHFLLTIALMIPAFAETSKAMNEKFVGISVLMSMNGISSSLNLLSWLVSGLLLSSVTSVASTFLMCFSSDKNILAFASSSNPFIIFLVLVFHMAHAITFDLHISAYISKAIIALPVIVLVNVFAIVMHIYVFEGNLFVAPYIGMIFPIILLYQAMNQIYAHEQMAEDLQWHNLFGNEKLMIEIEKSIGMIIVLSVMGMIFHFILALYAHAINPGRYGVGHHLLFFLMTENKSSNGRYTKKLTYNNVENKYFEPESAEVYTPGIQIRNLKKFYDIGIFNKEKVYALRDVSVDFYKGKITSLLGHNGAGKSTLMSILTRITSATDGLILINSKNLKSNACEILKDVGLCAQEDMHFPSLTVAEQLEFFAMVKRRAKSRSAIKENIKVLVESLKLSSVKDALSNDLSSDQKRKLSLAMALVGDPSTLILDEPTCGLDPHSKRIVWDVLLVNRLEISTETFKIKDQKTILISTHDMDEADILGDRIAILHDGQLKSYGTPLFLKNMIGGEKSVDVTLSIERWCDISRILKELYHEEAVVNKEAGEVVLSVPTLMLPQWLRTLEEKKGDLDVSGYNLTHVSLETVFLELTKENTGFTKSHCVVTRDQEKLKGLALQFQSARALFSKKMSYTLKNTSTLLLQILIVIITVLTIATIRVRPEQKEQHPIVPINLNMYYGPRTLFTNFNTTIGDQYATVSSSLGGKPTDIENKNLDNELVNWAKDHLAAYVKHMIAAAEFNGTANGTRANAFYSQKATYSLPLSVNLLWNAIVANLLGPDYSISLSSQESPNINLDIDFFWVMSLSMMTAAVLVMFLSAVMAMFIIHPSRERIQGIKQLQKLAGVSGLTYWGTMLLFDLMVCAFLALLLVVGFLSTDYLIGLHLYEADVIKITLLLLMLFAINVLPLIYTFSFIKTNTKNLVKLLTIVPVAIALLGVILIIYYLSFVMFGLVIETDEFITINLILKITMMLPYISLSHGYIVMHWLGMTVANCKRLPNIYYEEVCPNAVIWELCCELNCYDGKCLKSISYFEDEVFSLRWSVAYLSLTSLLHFGILAIMECRLFPRLMAKFKKRQIVESAGDEQVQSERSIIFQQIQMLNGKKKKFTISRQTQHPKYDSDNSTNRDFLVYELQKNYKNVRAVADVSFGINRHESFGLFGVCGAGKSTCLKILTGEEIPDHGVVYLADNNSKHQKKSFLSQIGYCNQHDVTVKCLNTYDHLRLFARLRGIPECHVESEIAAWIDKLNLNACASLPSSTYSSGNKQRLNVAIALVGNPNLILLDEPTTRMDPGARRSLWNTIKSCQITGQTFLLASNNMDECAAVCNRMAIMTDGKLTCIGTPKELKQRFGDGYDVQIRMNPRKASFQLDQVKKDIRLSLHCLLTNENLDYLMYSIAGSGTTWKKVYEVMNKIKRKYDCIDDFLVIVRLST